jgi:hypothetical protein
MTNSPFEIRRATCRVLFVFDVGREIDLAAVRRLAPDLVREPPSKGGRPAAVAIDSPPLRLETATSAQATDGVAVESVVAVGVYDFGAVALTYAVPASGSLADLRAAGCRLSGHAAIAAAARRDVADFTAKIASAVADPALSPVVEEYLIFETTEFACATPLGEVPSTFGQEIAQLLRSETQTLSAQEVAHATRSLVTRTEDDLAVVDWNAALVVAADPRDVREILELANVQLLEMRFLDRRLDEALAGGYDVVARGLSWRPAFFPGGLREAMRRIAQQQVDAAILHERVSNALKLVGDQHLARVYRRASESFDLGAWNAEILQKLETVDGIYEKLHDRAATARSEMLEWLVILLILVSMAMPFFM